MSDAFCPRILISHSAREGRARALRDSIHTALVAEQNNNYPRYRVYLDERDNQAGELWRQVNEEWLWHSDGVVLMLNNAALREESFVLYEVTILWVRWRRFPDHFRFVIVRFPDVDDELIERRLKPFQFPDIQQIKLTNAFRDDSEQVPSEEVEEEIAKVTATVVNQMEKLQRDRSRDWIEEHLVDTLQHQTRDNNQLYELCELLAIDPQISIRAKPEVCRWIIRKLLGSGGAIGEERLEQLRIAVDQLVTLLPSPEHVRRFINYILPYCWVHPEAAARLCFIACRPDGPRTVVWRRNWDLSEKMYLLRALCKPLSRIVPVYLKSGDLEDCKTKVHQALAIEFQCGPMTPAKTVRERIQRFEKRRGEPVCVVLAAMQTGHEIITSLTQEWPEVLFFLFERETDPSRLGDWELEGVERVQPALDLLLEAYAMDDWSELMNRTGVDKSEISTGKAFS